ncbi:chloramphenicol acetyltransferase [Algibacter amylolyticus]|uniref:Chloramphenicol acetyltransferase n=1 Tax=Algibacter amylolyticus TaxID=1608400 RepID=A0A5M7AVN7_9FLAO|nr:CatA-like O-acetyltransferase [Algibacter amylolyticus]KAA5821473.1 chloramphenicol acetyltransferase [Algibacter amylolyticus]MBB5268350.1 chloramphenicol O-acetyltransferase type A [Algibacter amylolyticus]TSJ72985.1 chloramphenicol acetyltransferase [Algibacter amylolyticus]
MKIIDVNTWNRKQHYEHFSALTDPYFGLVIPFNVTKAYYFSKEKGISFFGKYLHACMRAINEVENFKYRIENGNVVEHDVIHASSTIMREDKTIAFSFIDYNENLGTFLDNLEAEKERVKNSNDLFPPKNGLNCIHCSAMPWLNFTGHKEPVSGEIESVPKIAFSKISEVDNELMINVAINVNHALIDGYHVGLFSEKFQQYLNQ